MVITACHHHLVRAVRPNPQAMEDVFEARGAC
jgi:hypothetical protein